jgi:hypothetical protein
MNFDEQAEEGIAELVGPISSGQEVQQVHHLVVKVKKGTKEQKERQKVQSNEPTIEYEYKEGLSIYHQ